MGSKPGSSYCALQCLASSKALQIFDHAICQLAFAPESPQHEKKSPGTQCQESRHGMKAVLGASYAEQSWTSKVVWQNRAAPPALRSAQHVWPQQNQQAQTTPDLRQAHTLPAARGHRKARIRRTATVAPERVGRCHQAASSSTDQEASPEFRTCRSFWSPAGHHLGGSWTRSSGRAMVRQSTAMHGVYGSSHLTMPGCKGPDDLVEVCNG